MSCLPGMSCFQNTSYSSGCGCGGYTTIYYPNGCSSSQCLSSNYVCYSGPNQPNSGVNNGDTLTDIIQKIDAVLAGGGFGTVTSIGLTSTDITVGGTSPITTFGTFTLTLPNINLDIGTFNNLTVNAKGQVTAGSNTAYLTAEIDPVANAKTVTLTGGTGVSILGAAQTIGVNPAFTITNTAPDQIVALTSGIGISATGIYPNFTITNTSPDQTVTLTAGSNISITGSYPSFTIASTAGGGISGLTTNRIPYATSTTTLGDVSTLTWDPINNALTVSDLTFHSTAGITNTFMGSSSGNFTITGTSNTALGRNTLVLATAGIGNTAIGTGALSSSTGSSNGNSALGFNSLSSVTSGDLNIGIGRNAGNNITIGTSNIIIGADISAQSISDNFQLSIQNIIFGTNNSSTGTTVSPGSIGIGTPLPDRRFHVEVDDATNNAVTYAQRLTHTTSGTPATGIGVGVEFEIETDTGNNEIGATIEAVATDVASTSEDVDLVLKTMLAGAAATEKFRITSDGRIYGTALHNNAGDITGILNQYLASGTYTPILTGVTNVTSTTSRLTTYARIGNAVIGAGVFDVTPTVAGLTVVGISIPIPSNFTTAYQAGGSGHSPATSGHGAAIYADPVNDRIEFSYVDSGGVPSTMSYIYLYEIV